MGKLGVLVIFVASLAFADKAAAPPPAKKPAAQKAVKSMSRAELETEVEGLRADNAKLKVRVDELLAKEKDRALRMEKAVGQPASTLK
jgi:ABC-type transporter MlaC component